ncbi:hypothetical protein [Hymenobacter sp. BT559]|uniref:hypothetical protein n=1 Tax=Hymenobacter sp. BT559 TaxID=2795729 RepID=UPI0018ECFD81|nr:hypothetical protein [Hymenobacter sp. BT559]MBJ6143611.1 hypothetical protein [Hymenobacter sp. BT559]
MISISNNTIETQKIKHSRQSFTTSNTFFFSIAFLLFLIHLLTSRFFHQPYDAAGYWSLANEFDVNGTQDFSIYNFHSKLRGYLLPLLYYPAVVATRSTFSTNPMVLPKIMGAVQAGVLFGILSPMLWQRVTRRPISMWRRLAFIFICFLLWRDHFNFVLTDFPALLALIAGLLLAYGSRPVWYAFFVGMCGALALYIRPVYIATLPLLLILLWQQSIYHYKRSFAIRIAIQLGLFILGTLAVATPQYLINSKNFSLNNFLVSSETKEYQVKENKSLYLWHLNAGLVMQRYETNIGSDYPEAQMVFGDRAGLAMHLNNGGGSQHSYLDYIRYGGFVLDSYKLYGQFVLKQPIDMLALYSRHAFNGLDVLYSSPYIVKVHSSTFLLTFVNYTALFLALLTISRYWHHLRLGSGLVVATLALVGLVAIPTVVECRFFIGLHLMLLGIACFGSQFSKQSLIPQKLAPLLGAYTLFLLFCFTLSSNTQASLEMEAKTIHSKQLVAK